MEVLSEVKQDVAVLKQRVDTLNEWQIGAEHRMTELETAAALSAQNQRHVLEGLNELKGDVKSHMSNSRNQYDDLRTKVVAGGTLVAVGVFIIQALPQLKGLF